MTNTDSTDTDQLMTQDERRSIDKIREARGVSAEAAELIEHVIESDKMWRRDKLLLTAVGMIDDVNKLCFDIEQVMDDEL